MEVIIGSVCPKETEDIAVPQESGQCDNEIYATEDHEIPLGEIVRAGGIEGSETTEKVNEVMGSIDGEQEEHAIREEPGNTDNGQNDAENFREGLDLSIKHAVGCRHSAGGGRVGGSLAVQCDRSKETSKRSPFSA